jgi:hypothetical protein
MKSKLIALMLLFMLGFSHSSFSQSNKKTLDLSKIVWFGVDFTAAKFSFVTENPTVIINKYLKEINMLVISEPVKYDIKKFFSITELINNIDPVNEFNLKIDPSSFVITNDYKLNIDQVKSVIKKYNIKDESGTGLIFVAENLNKVSKMGSYYVCFFDIATKEIIDSRRMEGSVTGIGFRNFWAYSIYQVMKGWAPK